MGSPSALVPISVPKFSMVLPFGVAVKAKKDWFSYVDRLKTMQYTTESNEVCDIRFLTDADIPEEVISKLSSKDFDYKKGINPIKIVGIRDFTVRVNCFDDMAVSFIENSSVIYILAFDKVDKIISSSINLYNQNKVNIMEKIMGANYER